MNEYTIQYLKNVRVKLSKFFGKITGTITLLGRIVCYYTEVVYTL